MSAGWLFQGLAAVSPHPNWGALLFLLGTVLVAVGIPEPIPAARSAWRLGAITPLLLLAAWPAMHLGQPYGWVVFAAIVLGTLWIGLPSRCGSLASYVIRGGLALGILAFQAVISIPLATLEMQHGELPVVADLAAGCLKVLGQLAGTESSTLLLSYPEGMHGFRSTCERLAIPFFAQFVAAGWLLRTALGDACSVRWVWAGLTIGIFAIVRFALLALASAHESGALELWCEPVPLLVSLCPFPVLIQRALFIVHDLQALRPQPRRRMALPCLAASAGLLFAWGVNGFDPGQAKGGRVLIDNAHGDWEDTNVVFDRTHFGTYAVYAYSELARVLGYYFDVETVEEPELTRERLATCDILVLKTPLRPYAPGEIDATIEFVRSGGGVLLLGDHTNFLAVNAHLNEVSVPLGIEFRADQALAPYSSELFTFRSPSPLLRHPILAGVESFQTMTGCTFRLGSARGESAIVDGPLFAEEADYGEMGFFGPGKADGWDTCGLQRLAAASHFGLGRAVALGDSTIFSNFTMHDEGRRELILGSIAYLNRSNWLPWWHKPVAEVVGWIGLVAVLAIGLRVLWREGSVLPLLAAIFAASLGVGILGMWKQCSYRLPDQVRPVPFCNVWMDPACGSRNLEHRSFVAGLARTGLVPRVVDDMDELLGDAEVLVLVQPATSQSRAQIGRVGDYVEEGGRLLLIDDPANHSSTARALLDSFGLSYRESVQGDDLRKSILVPAFGALSEIGPFLLLDAATLWQQGTPHGSSEDGFTVRRPFREILGGTPILNLGAKTAAVIQERGRGRVCVFTLGFAMSDRAMGDPIFSGLPSVEEREQYAILFALVDQLYGEPQRSVHKREIVR